MTIRHHPSDETLLAFAARTLAAGAAIVVAAHREACPICRDRIADFEAMGGALLEQLQPAILAPESLALTLAKIDSSDPAARPELLRRHRASAPLRDGIVLPASLQSCAIGPWRWLAPGIVRARVDVPEDPRARVILCRIEPNRRLPEHGHTGTEFTQVISGSFSDGRSRYFPGDLVEADRDVDHQPVVDPDGPCVCLIAMQGEMRLRGIIGRLLQPFVGI